MSNIDNLTQQILSQGTTSSWSGQGLGGPEANAREMARLMDAAGITDINDFGIVSPTKFVGGRPAIYIDSDTWTAPTENPFRPGTYQTFTGTRGQYAVFNPDWNGYDFFDPSAIVNTPEGPKLGPVELPSGEPSYFGNIRTKQPIQQGYNKVTAPSVSNGTLGGTFSGTYSGKGRTNFNVAFKDGKPVFYTQFGGDTSSVSKDLGAAIGIGLSLFAPGIGGAIGSAITGTAATTLASQAIGAAIVQGVLAEAQGGDFLDGAIKGAVTAGVAPAVASTVGTAVADVMADSAIKNAVASAISSSAASAVTAALTNGDVDQAALTGALAAGVGSVGRELGTAAEYGTTPFSEQTQQLMGQEVGLGTTGSLGSELGKAAGSVAAGADSTQALLSALIRSEQERAAATGTPVPAPSPAVAEAPVTVPGAENVAELISGGGEQVAGPAGMTLRLVEAMPQMLPRENEVAEDVVVDQLKDGSFVYRRNINGTTKDGKEYSYSITYDPNNEKRPISYDYSYFLPGDEKTINAVVVLSAKERPVFDSEGKPVVSSKDIVEQIPIKTETGVSTDVSLPTETLPTRFPTEAPSFVPEQVNILDLLASGKGDISQGQPLTVAPTGPFGPVAGPITAPEGGEIAPAPEMGGAGVAAPGLPSPLPQEISIPDQISQVLGGGGGVGGAGVGAPLDIGSVPGAVPGAGAGEFPGAGTEAGAGAGAGVGIGEGAVAGGVPEADIVSGIPGAEPPVDVVGEIPEEIVAAPEEIPEEVPAEETKEPTEPVRPFVREQFISDGRRRMGPTVQTLGQALQPPLFPTAPASGLTAYRGAGEIETGATGKERRNVWNVASLRLKDALGI